VYFNSPEIYAEQEIRKTESLKLCELLWKCNVWNTLVTQKWKLHSVIFFPYPKQVRFVLHLFACTSQTHVRLYCKYFTIIAVPFLQLLFLLDLLIRPLLETLVEGRPHLSLSPARKCDGRQIWKLQSSEMDHNWQGHRSATAWWIKFINHCGCVVALEYCHFTVDVWWRWNIVTSLWMCSDAGILSLHCLYEVVVEYCHFSVDVWWRWNIVTSLLIWGGAGILSLHCWCVVTLEYCHFTVDVSWR